MSHSSVFESPHELLFEELKNAYERDWDRKEGLENKANHTITISGTVATLLFGFAAFLFANIHDHGSIGFLRIMIALTVSVALSITSILLSMLAVRIRDYTYVIHNIDLKEYKESTKYIVTNNLTNDYHLALQKNSDLNEKKSKWLKFSQWFLFFSILTILIPLALLLIRI